MFSLWNSRSILSEYQVAHALYPQTSPPQLLQVVQIFWVCFLHLASASAGHTVPSAVRRTRSSPQQHHWLSRRVQWEFWISLHVTQLRQVLRGRSNLQLLSLPTHATQSFLLYCGHSVLALGVPLKWSPSWDSSRKWGSRSLPSHPPSIYLRCLPFFSNHCHSFFYKH